MVTFKYNKQYKPDCKSNQYNGSNLQKRYRLYERKNRKIGKINMGYPFVIIE